MINFTSETQRQELYNICLKFIEDNGISCAESISQQDNIIINAYSLIGEICSVVGYVSEEAEVITLSDDYKSLEDAVIDYCYDRRVSEPGNEITLRVSLKGKTYDVEVSVWAEYDHSTAYDIIDFKEV